MGLGVRQDKWGKSRPPLGFEPRTFQPVASRYTDDAIPAPLFPVNLRKYIGLRLLRCSNQTAHEKMENEGQHLYISITGTKISDFGEETRWLSHFIKTAIYIYIYIYISNVKHPLRT